MSCLSDLKTWLTSNFLYLNENKTEIVVFGPRGAKGVAELKQGPLSFHVNDQVKTWVFILIAL